MSKGKNPQAEGAPMTLAQYQQQAMTTCLPESENFSYMMLNLVGEVGELASKVAKMITQTAMREKISPIVSQMTALIAEAFQVGFDAGMECGRYTDYSTKED